MQGIVTVIGSYNGAPAFEYEIRDDANALLALDIVIVHPAAGEGWDDLAAFVRDTYLPKRVAKWALSDTPRKRENRRELQSGGKRITELPKASTTPPLVRGGAPAIGHRVSRSVSVAEAESLRSGDAFTV